MKLHLYIYIVFFSVLSLHAQNEIDSLLAGKKYYEDQIYIGVTYDFFLKRTQEYQRTGLPIGFHLGFIKDIPLDSKGKIAFGIGAGYIMDVYKHNISFPGFHYNDLSGMRTSYTLHTHSIEVPVALRLRNSTPYIKAFERLYFGMRISYIFYADNIIRAEGEAPVKEYLLPYLDRLQYGPYLSIGYGNLNIYATYSIKPLFKRNTTAEQKVIFDLREIKMGLRLYIF